MRKRSYSALLLRISRDRLRARCIRRRRFGLLLHSLWLGLDLDRFIFDFEQRCLCFLLLRTFFSSEQVPLPRHHDIISHKRPPTKRKVFDFVFWMSTILSHTNAVRRLNPFGNGLSTKDSSSEEAQQINQDRIFRTTNSSGGWIWSARSKFMATTMK